jgi:hypothetical protein
MRALNAIPKNSQDVLWGRCEDAVGTGDFKPVAHSGLRHGFTLSTTTTLTIESYMRT